MKKMPNMFILLTLSILVSCNSKSSSPVSSPVNPASDLSGTVSSVLNFMNPISSAHAADAICTTPGGSNKGVQIYLVDKNGNEKIICYATLNANGSFNAKIRDNLIPINSKLKIKATMAGGVREAIVNKGSLNAVSVDPASTLAAPLIHDQWVKGHDLDAKEVRIKIRDYIEGSLRSHGVKVSEMRADKIAQLQMMFKNSPKALAMTLFNNGDNSVVDDSFKVFLKDGYTKTRMGSNGYLSDPGQFVYSGENLITD